MTVTTGRATRGKTRYGAPNHERGIWLFMRLSGLVMFITVVFPHAVYAHGRARGEYHLR